MGEIHFIRMHKLEFDAATAYHKCESRVWLMLVGKTIDADSNICILIEETR